MNATIKTRKIEAATKQIEALRSEQARIADKWLTVGYKKTAEACEAIADQITALYEEIDAIEADETTQASRIENNYHQKSDEKPAPKMPAVNLDDLGWNEEDLARYMRKMSARAGRR